MNDEPFLRCPACGNTERFILSVDGAATVRGDDVVDDDADWYFDSRTICVACDHTGTVESFDGTPTRHLPRYRVSLMAHPGAEVFHHEASSLAAAIDVARALEGYVATQAAGTVPGYGSTTTIEVLDGDDWIALEPTDIERRTTEGD